MIASSVFTIRGDQVYFGEDKLRGVSSVKFETISYVNKNDETYVRCLRDVKGIWYFKSRGKGVVKFLTEDVVNFRFIDDDYARDGQSVFLIAKNGFRIHGSDADTFELIRGTPYFAKDKNQLYALDSSSGLSVYGHADCDSIMNGDGHQYVTDKHNLYRYGIDLNLANSQKYLNYFDPSFPYEARADKSAFQANREYFLKRYPLLVGWWHGDYPFQINVEAVDQLGYNITQNAIFYLENNRFLDHHVPTVLPDANCASFKALNAHYGMDGKHVYFKSMPLLADVDTFEIINGHLARDKSNYYYNGNRIPCDYQSFEAVDDYNMFYRDRGALFSTQQIRLGKVGMRYEIITTLVAIKNSSPSTIEVFSAIWAKDDHQVYRYGKPFKKADVSTFEYLNITARYEWAKDRHHLYSSSVKKIVKGINGKAFHALNQFWGKDENNVVFFPTEGIRASIDAGTFKITDEQGGAMDRYYTYSVDEAGACTRKKRNVSS